MPELKLPDATLHFEISGEGPPLLMVAGFMSDSASWAPLLPLLEPHFTLIRPDNRTTGRTRPDDAPVSFEIWVKDTLALLEHLNIGRVHLLGHSLGGLIAWAMAADAPERIAGCMMMGSAPIGMHRNFHLFQQLIRVRNSDAPEDTWLRLLFPWLFSVPVYEQPGFLETAVADGLAYPYAQSAEAMALQLEAISGMQAERFAKPPPVPMRCLLGEDDLLVPLARAAESMPQIDQRIIAGAGHSIHWEQPETVAEMVLEFVRGIAAES